MTDTTTDTSTEDGAVAAPATEPGTVTPDWSHPQWELTWVDPRTLLTDKNIRDITPDPEMVTSVRLQGVLQPIMVVRTRDDQLRVRFGEGRTLAAIAAAVDQVPVIVLGIDGESDTEEVARIIQQRDENVRRQGMKRSEDAGAVHQLALLGVSEKDISETMQLKRSEVRAAKKIAKSAAMTEMIDANPGYDLLTMAKIAEFEDNPERFATLTKSVKHNWEFESQIRRWRREDAEQAEIARVRNIVEAQGLTVSDSPARYGPNDAVRYVAELQDESGEAIDPEQHRQCPGHAVVIESAEFYTMADGTMTTDVRDLPEEEQAHPVPAKTGMTWVAVCTQAVEQHLGPARPEQTEQEAAAEFERAMQQAELREAERAQRRRVIAGNKEWDAAVATRREWVRKLLTRKTLPAGGMEFLTRELAGAEHHVRRAFESWNRLAADLLQLDTMKPKAVANAADQATDKRRAVILLGIVLAANEEALHRHSWRRENRPDGCEQRAYLRLLIDLGYPACAVERLAAGLNEAEDIDDLESAQDDTEDAEADTDDSEDDVTGPAVTAGEDPADGEEVTQAA